MRVVQIMHGMGSRKILVCWETDGSMDCINRVPGWNNGLYADADRRGGASYQSSDPSGRSLLLRLGHTAVSPRGLGRWGLLR